MKFSAVVLDLDGTYLNSNLAIKLDQKHGFNACLMLE